MGAVDTVTLHLQYWFLLAGFAAALTGLLAPRVRQAILFPFLLLLLVMPSVVERVADGRADLPLAYLVAVAAVLVLLWVERPHAWRLTAAVILLAGAVVTKREGVILARLVLAAAFAASWRGRRGAWRRLSLAALAVGGVAAAWQGWLRAHELASGAPQTGLGDAFGDPGRGVSALWLVARTMADVDAWLLAPPLAVAAVCLAALAGATRAAAFAGALLAASLLACTLVIWSDPSLEITQDYGLNPVVRFVGGPVLIAGSLTPILLDRALGPQAAGAAAPAGARSALAWLLVAAALVGYPASALTGYAGFRLPGGLPTFPSADECAEPPVEGAPVRLVLGYRESYAEAETLRARAARAGFAGAEIAQDGCGRLRVSLDRLPSLADGRSALARAREAGFSARLERARR